MKTENEIKEIAKQLAHPTGEKGKEISDLMNKSNQYLTQKTFEVANLKKESIIIELGPGNGKLSEPIFNKVNQYIGIDNSKLMIELCEESFSGHKNCQFVHSDIIQYKPTHQADIIFAVNFLYFIEDSQALFEHLYQWLKPGGKLILSSRSLETLNKLPITKYGFQQRESELIINELEKAGFKSNEIKHLIEPKLKSDRQVEVDFDFKSEIIIAWKE